MVRGQNITPGYWKDPKKTTDTFDGEWYKTGDQGYMDEDGYLHLSGRKKDMIVLANGQNVFPEDIESVLNRHPQVTEAVVVGVNRGSDTQVHAVLILEDNSRSNEVVIWANNQLASHQRIRGHNIWEWGDFPKTHTLKVKKNLVLEAIENEDARGLPESSTAPNPSQGRSVETLISEVSGVPLSQVTPDKSLGDDLNLDSLGRVEILSAIEAEFGAYIDESVVTPETTVARLNELVSNAAGSEGPRTFPTWGMRFWCRMVRGFIQRTMIFPLILTAYKIRVTGAETFHAMDEPVLFAANHVLHLDNGIIIKAIPSSRRRWLAIAASDHMWSNPFKSVAIPLLGNGFPFSKEENVRASLENLGRILDNGWSVLIYPEGELTVGGPMKPFLSGMGLLAVGGQVPVVPMKLHIRKIGRPNYLPILRRGDVEIRFGEPLTFSPSTDFDDATRRIESAVQAL
ncbi:MAG: AMP-binding protein [Chloroflexi bacterium]|nr:AMP-binding protein [Chloroflexota bacterium]